MIEYICINCGFSAEVIKGCDVKCYKCRRLMYPKREIKNEQLIRDEMITCFDEQQELPT